MKKLEVFPLGHSRVALHPACISFIADTIVPLASNHFENYTKCSYDWSKKQKASPEYSSCESFIEEAGGETFILG